MRVKGWVLRRQLIIADRVIDLISEHNVATKSNDKIAINFLKERLKDENFRRYYFDEQFRKSAGQEIARIRKLKKITEAELSNRTGIPKSTIVKIEKGEVKRITIKQLLDLAFALEHAVNVVLEKPKIE